MSEEEYVQAIVIDTGSSLTKAGFAGDEVPRAVFPTAIGKQRQSPLQNNLIGTHDVYVGEESEASRNQPPKYPVVGGIIVDWDSVEKIWHHAFYNELKSFPENHPILMTETARNSKMSREKMTQTLFETFNVPAMYIASQSVLSLYSNNAVSGVVLESGDGITNVLPVYEGYAQRHALIELDLAGADATKYLRSILTQSGYSIEKEEIINDIKRKACEVALDFDSEIKTSSEKIKFELPDGNFIDLGPNERFKCAEILFRSSLIGLEREGIHEIIHRAIGYCELETRREYYKCIVLGGGNTMFKGFPERMNKEMINLVPNSIDIGIVASPDRRYSAWQGGSILASMESFSSLWISRDEYEEHGSVIVHKKCF